MSVVLPNALIYHFQISKLPLCSNAYLLSHDVISTVTTQHLATTVAEHCTHTHWTQTAGHRISTLSRTSVSDVSLLTQWEYGNLDWPFTHTHHGTHITLTHTFSHTHVHHTLTHHWLEWYMMHTHSLSTHTHTHTHDDCTSHMCTHLLENQTSDSLAYMQFVVDLISRASQSRHTHSMSYSDAVHYITCSI